MDVSEVEKAKVKLITLLNVASARNASKRKTGEDWHEIARRAKKSRAAATAVNTQQQEGGLVEVEEQADDVDEQELPVILDQELDEDDDIEDENGEPQRQSKRNNIWSLFLW